MGRFVKPFLSLCALLLAGLGLAACGHETEEVQPLAWPFMENTSSVSINGTSFSAYVAKTEAHRRRAQNGLAIKSKQAIAYLFPKQEDAPTLRFRGLPEAVDLVFVDGDGKVQMLEQVPAFSSANFPRDYACKGSRVVLQLPKGSAAELKLERGGAVKTEPDLLAQANEAEGEFATLFFIKNQREDEKPEEAPFVKLTVLEEAEDVARGMKDRDLKDGEGVLLPLGGSGKHHEFWLKEVQGKVCACYIERSQSGRGQVISALYEGIEATAGSDLDQPVYYSPAAATHLAIFKGSDFFTKNKIEKRSNVVIGGDAFSSEEPDYGKLEFKFGDVRLEARLADSDGERETALAEAPSLKPGKASLLAWDDAAFVKFSAPAGANLWFIETDGKGKYSVGEKVRTQGGEVKATAKSRFVLAVPADFDAAGALTVPYAVRDLRPALPALVFYNAKQKDVVKDRWPGEKDSLRARVHVELAITQAEQQRGLMYRESLKPNHGMLFLYSEEEEMSYWMKNCRMNLSIAFVNERGEIIKIHPVMKAPAAGTVDAELERYESDGLARFAIEMEENWFEKNGVKVGDRIFIPPALLKEK
ncbi:MAG: DUF192 domain-containing protein [Planctomycetes bacterium]|nr:DUF192 domain-containing protein [Planctomycetota bacterium]